MLICPPASIILVAAPMKSVTLRYKYVPGQTRRYKLHTRMDTILLPGVSGAQPALAVTIDLIIRQTVQNVRASDGAATSIGQVEEFHVFSNGKETSLPYPSSVQMKRPYTVVSLPSGKVLSVQLSAPLPGLSTLYPGKEFSGPSVTFPSHPLKVGDSWAGTTAAATGPILRLTNTLTGFDTTNGVLRAIIQQKTIGTLNKPILPGTSEPVGLTGTVTGEGTLVFDIESGAISRLAAVSKVDMKVMPVGPKMGVALGNIVKVAETSPRVTVEQKTQVTMTSIEDTLSQPTPVP